MLWIKRNLVLVIGIVISVALLGGAGYYLYANSEENFARDDELDKLKVELDQLKGGVFPSDSNIGVIKSNSTQIRAFMTEGERLFASAQVKAAGESQIKVGLANFVDAMRRDATNAGVEVPARYEFTYGEVKAMPRLPSYALDPLTNQLKEVSVILHILFNARVRALESFQRVPVFADEPRSADLITDRVTQTNVLSTNVSLLITPYRIVIRGFSSHLTDMLNGFSNAKEFFAVRQVEVEPAAGVLDTPAPGMPSGMTPTMLFGGGQPTPGLNPPGVPGFGTPPPGPVSPTRATPAPGVVRPPPPKAPGGLNAPPPPKSSLTKVLDEKPLRITLSLDAVRVLHGNIPPPPAPAK